MNIKTGWVVNTVSPTNMKISLISIPLACAVISSCQYRPKNFYADKYPDNGIKPTYNAVGHTSPTYEDSYASSSLSGGNINYIHRQGSTSGNWNASTGNFVLNGGNTFEIGEDKGKVKLVANVDKLEIIELRLTNVYGGRDYHVDVDKVMNGGLTMKVDKGSYRLDIRNRWETHSKPSGFLTVEW